MEVFPLSGYSKQWVAFNVDDSKTKYKQFVFANFKMLWNRLDPNSNERLCLPPSPFPLVAAGAVEEIFVLKPPSAAAAASASFFKLFPQPNPSFPFFFFSLIKINFSSNSTPPPPRPYPSP